MRRIPRVLIGGNRQSTDKMHFIRFIYWAIVSEDTRLILAENDLDRRPLTIPCYLN